MKDDLKSYLPLTPATLHIMLALAAEDRHGYAIMQEVARQSVDQYKLGPGTLYENLDKLAARGLVKRTSSPSSSEDSRRRYYRLTDLGRRVVSADVERLKSVVKEAKLHLPAAESSRS
ncbi:MAG: helix-turn-helix transcriptional regulator [Candidatus Acidiferrales bacterium]